MTREEVITHLTDIKTYMVAGNPIWDVDLVKKVFDIAIYTMGSISKLEAERDAALQCTCCEYRVGSLCCYSDVMDGEVIRCKDCKWHGDRFCNNFNVMGFDNDDYCSLAERKKDE